MGACAPLQPRAGAPQQPSRSRPCKPRAALAPQSAATRSADAAAAVQVARWFGYLGIKLPYGVNVADFVLDCSSGVFAGDPPVLGARGADRQGRLIEVRRRGAARRAACANAFAVCLVSVHTHLAFALHV
jgi:hypothetical protein